VTAFERIKNCVGPVRMEAVLKSWGESVRKRNVSRDWTRKNDMYASLRWPGFDEGGSGKGDIVEGTQGMVQGIRRPPEI
jgi:hypothetical protein